MKDRIQAIIKEMGLTAWKFAEIVEVQPSNISHILSGRNKPSFDFIEKIMVKFPEVNPDWLILGKGAMYRESNVFTDVNPVSEELDNEVYEGNTQIITSVNDTDNEMFTEIDDSQPIENHAEITNVKQEPLPVVESSSPAPVLKVEEREDIPTPITNPDEEIEKIIVLYKSGRFKYYKPF